MTANDPAPIADDIDSKFRSGLRSSVAGLKGSDWGG